MDFRRSMSAFAFGVWRQDKRDSWICLYMMSPPFLWGRCRTDLDLLWSACRRRDSRVPYTFKGILVINIASNVCAMSYMKTTENILYCSLIPFEKLCLTKCTEKSFECFLNYFLFPFFFRRGDCQSSFVSCWTQYRIHWLHIFFSELVHT